MGQLIIITKDDTVVTFSNLSWQGNWVDGIYAADDAVAYTNKMWWASAIISAGQEPGVHANWVLIPAGPEGAQGPAGPASVSTSITGIAGLAAEVTTTITVGGTGSILMFVDSTDEILSAWQLRASTDATVAGSIQRPDDYAATTNEKVWFRCL